MSDRRTRLAKEAHSAPYLFMPEKRVARLVSVCPDELLERWAAGPWPEPFCGVCRALDELYGHCYNGWPEDNKLARVVVSLVLYHEAPMKVTFDADPWRARSAAGRWTYRRCVRIYEAAAEELARRLGA